MRRSLLLLVLLLLMLPGAVSAQGRPDLRPMQKLLDAAMISAEKGDTTAVSQSYAAIDESWEAVEDGVRASQPDLYREIEDALGRLQVAVLTKPLNLADAQAALKQVDQEVDELAAVTGASGTEAGAT